MFHLVLVVFSLAASPSRPETEAERSFREGRKLLQEGRIADACVAFEESHRMDPALGTLLNLAECEAVLGHDVRAYALFQEVLGWSRRTRNAAREKVALERLATLKPKLALVVVDAPAGAQVELDGQQVAAGTQVALAPGPHEVVVKHGDEVRQQHLELSAGDVIAAKPSAPAPQPVAVVEPRLEPKPAVVEPAVVVAPPPPAVSSSRRTAGIAVLAAGAAVLVAGIAGTAWAANTWQRAERQQPGGPDFDAPTVTASEYRTAGTVYPVSIAVMAVGALAAAGGGALVLSGTF